jgi:unsaturated rhamnogalacturonyl hydrolase
MPVVNIYPAGNLIEIINRSFMSQISPQKHLAMNSWAVRMLDSILQDYPRSQWIWHYEHGLLLKAVLEVGQATGMARYEQFVRDWVDHFVLTDGTIRTYRMDEFNLDQINSGKLLFPIYRQTNEQRYRSAIELLQEQLRCQPRVTTGNFWHKNIYPHQVWLDGLYMVAPFEAEYAATFNKPEIFDDLTHQIMTIEQRVRDPITGLLYHGWDELKKQKWADPDTGCSPHFWGRAVGWYFMAIVDVLDFLPRAHPSRSDMINILIRLAQALTRTQDPASGLWFQVLDLPERPGNYREASVSAMLAYGFAKAVRKSYLVPEYLSAAQRAYRGLLANMIRVNGRGALTLEGICVVSGLGGDPYRDGSFEYYVGEPTAPNDFKGVGPFILASLEMESSGVEPAGFNSP